MKQNLIYEVKTEDALKSLNEVDECMKGGSNITTNITPDDLVFNKTGGNITAAGYLINSVLLNNTVNSLTRGGGIGGGNLSKDLPLKGRPKSPKKENNDNDDNKLNDLMIPAGVFLFIPPLNKNKNNIKGKLIGGGKDEVVSEDLYDKLLHLMSPKTRKNYDNKTRKSRELNKTKIKHENKSRKIKLKIHE
jgi:hypothetical protein